MREADLLDGFLIRPDPLDPRLSETACQLRRGARPQPGEVTVADAEVEGPHELALRHRNAAGEAVDVAEA